MILVIANLSSTGSVTAEPLMQSFIDPLTRSVRSSHPHISVKFVESFSAKHCFSIFTTALPSTRSSSSGRFNIPDSLKHFSSFSSGISSDSLSSFARISSAFISNASIMHAFASGSFFMSSIMAPRFMEICKWRYCLLKHIFIVLCQSGT